MKFYTNVFQRGNYLYVRGIDDGTRFSERVEFYPTVWINGKIGAAEEWKTLDDQPVFTFKPGNIRETNQYIEENKDVHGRQIYSSPGHAYQYIAEQYTNNISWDRSKIVVYSIDIETEAEGGFPDPKTASEEILLISVKNQNTNKIITFGRKPYEPKQENVRYVHCESESSLLRAFISWWGSDFPDIVTGWNTAFFDLTYLYNRICNVLGEDIAKKLSPWGFVYQRDVQVGSKTDTKTNLMGIACLDYLDLYKKFGTYSAKESYKLDHIAFEELGEKKLENPESTFRDFYLLHPELFISYNILDVELIHKLDNKLKLIDLVLTLAYESKCNYEDVFSPVKMWDVIIYNYLNDRRVVIPIQKVSKKSAYEGGYVKDSLVGKHNWLISFDLNSLYPHLIQQYNLSTETITPHRLSVTVDDLLNKSCDLQLAYENNLSVAANGCCFRKDIRGLLPTLMELFYNKRVQYKKEMINQKKLYEETPDPHIKNEIARLNNMQKAIKIAINAAYGALANIYCRYYDIRIAEAITLSGQLSIRWIANRLNDFMNETMKTDNVDRIVLIDTDSIVLCVEDLIEKVCKDKSIEEKIAYMDKISEKIIQPFIDKSYQELAEYMNAYEQKMVMKRENLIDRAVIVAKKNYVMSVYNSEGVQYHEPKLKIMGLQMIKSSTPTALKSTLKESLKKILHGSEQDIQEFISDYKDEFMNHTPEEIAFPRGVSDLGKYTNASMIYSKGTPIHVRGSLLYNNLIKKHKLTHKYPVIQDGEKIKFLYLKMPNPIHEDVIAFIDKLPEEFDLHNYIDYNKMFEKTFQDAIQNVVEPLGWSTEPKSTLEDWFE